MNIQQIKYLLAVEELQNFSAAADKCFISQSTLSTMVGRFENEIGVQVFDRKTKPVTITKEGELILRQLKVIAKEIDVLHEEVQSLKGEFYGTLKIGIIPTVAPYLLPAFLNDFAKKFPKITFSVSEMNTQTITDLLHKRELDVGILAIPLESADLVEHALYNEPFVLYDCSSKPLKKYVKLEQLDFDKFWLLEEGHCLSKQVTSICDLDNCRNNESINIDFRAGSIDSLIRFVKINRGMTLLPYLATLDFTAKDNRRMAQFQTPVPVRTIGLTVHKHFVKKQILNLLKEKIQEKILPLLKNRKKEQVVAPI